MNTTRSNSQIAGIIMAVTSVLSVVLITLHPTINAHELSLQIAEVANKAKLNSIVHGGFICLLMLNLLAFTGYSISRGLHNIMVMAALMTYTICTLLMAGAALVNGFIFPNFLQDIADHHQNLIEYTPLIRVFSWNVNQTLGNASVVGTSIAIVFWSLNLVNANWVQRTLALGGLFIGIIIMVALLSGRLQLDLIGMTLVICMQGLWNFGLGYLLIFNKLVKNQT